MLFDDKGKALDLLPTCVSGGVEGFANSFEFLKADENTKYIKLVPIEYVLGKQSPKNIVKDIDKLPQEFKISPDGSIIVEDVTFGANDVKIKYRKKGLSLPSYLCVFFMDEFGNKIEPLGGSMMEEIVNREDNSYTNIITSYSEKCDFSKCKKIYMPEECKYKLLEDEAIIINLE